MRVGIVAHEKVIDLFNNLHNMTATMSTALPRTKLSILLELMENEQWNKALSLAAKFRDLGAHKEAITRGHNAATNPAFYRQLGKAPETLVEAGIKALKERYLK